MDEWWIEPMRRAFGGRRVVLAGAMAAAWTEHVPILRSAGADDILVIATQGRGAGELPDVETVIVDMPTDLAMMDQIRFGEQALAEPPATVVDALERFDPRREAVAVGTFLNTTPVIDGRPFMSYRRAEWVALEDKVVIDAFWDRAGVERQPSLVVELGQASEASRRIDRGAGSVWAADARDGFHGGASATYWVNDGSSQRRALAGLRSVCDRVRVMPFLEGIPCSIHGIVMADGVAVMRPVEMVTLRRGHDFVYAGCATFWDPEPADRHQMRSIARRVGDQLATEVGFRGTFTVDGVVTADGFWPTELNPRFGAGINTIARASDVPILLLNELIGGGHDVGLSADRLEDTLVTSADADRGGGTWMGGLSLSAGADGRHVVCDGAKRWGWSTDHRGRSGTLRAGEHFLRCAYEPSATPTGPSTAARAASFWEFAADELGTDTSGLVPAAAS